MPLMDKDIAEDQEARNEEVQDILEREFEKDDVHADEEHSFAKKDFNLKNKSEIKKNDAKEKKSNIDALLGNISRIQRNRASFQKAVEANRKESANKVGVLVK